MSKTIGANEKSINISIIVGVVLPLNSIVGITLRSTRVHDPIDMRILMEENLLAVDRMIGPENRAEYCIKMGAIVRQVEVLSAAERRGINELDFGLWLSGVAATVIITLGAFHAKRAKMLLPYLQ